MTRRIVACLALVLGLGACKLPPNVHLCVTHRYTPTQVVDLRLHAIHTLFTQHRITRPEYFHAKSELLLIRDDLVQTGN